MASSVGTSPPMPTASGIECVRVLLALGWVAAHWTTSECHLENGRFALTVPLDGALSSERIAAIADMAGVPRIAFVAGLERVRTHDMEATARRISS
jgi:hypothetical protein